MAKNAQNPTIAAVLSLVVPGIGQIYTGNLLWALFFLVATPGFWIGTGGLLGWVFHIWAAAQAHGQAKR